MHIVRSRKIYSWALETGVSGEVSAASISEAAEQFRNSGRFQVWLLDAENATDFADDAMDAIRSEIPALASLGLDRIALVLPPAAAFAVMMVKATIALPIHSFGSRAEALGWIRGGCR